MKKINFNKNWQFTLDTKLDAYNDFGFLKCTEANGAPARFYDYSNWERVDLPHDWAVALPKDLMANTMSGARASTSHHRFFTEKRTNLDHAYNVGWYRKDFFLESELENKRIFIEFEGVYRDCIVWVNGTYIDRHNSGYTGFIYDITDQLFFGEDNSIAVRVNTEEPEGWWYEGAGIYRNVWLLVGEPMYVKPNKTVIKTALDGTVTATAVLVNDTSEEKSERVLWRILDKSGNLTAEADTEVSVAPYGEQTVCATFKVACPILWGLDTPYLYTLNIKACDEAEQRFGIRTVDFDADRGFFLNGKSVKLNGACVHQDFGGVGVALTDNLQRYKIAKLKKMGVNAYRCSHNAPAPALLDACDELGMLVMNETRMFGTAPEALRQLTDLVERDRNHPSVFIWSIGNEEFSVQNTEYGKRLAQKVCRILRKLDDTRPNTYGGSNGENFAGINAAVDVRGVNYIRNSKAGGKWLDVYHADHPTQPIVGTEESSYVLSRGAAKTDFGSGILDSTGNVTMAWGSTPKGWVKFYEKRPYMSGGFMWTGFDYRGEPNPYVYTNVSSSFGTIDLCGMPKPPFYYYKSWWTSDTVLKILPHWNYKKGEDAAVQIYTNCEQVKLTLNGKTVGTYTVEPFDFITVKLPFEAGTLRAEGVRNGKTYTDTLTTSGKICSVQCQVVLTADREEDVSIVELRGIDADGVFCPLASDRVELSIPDGEIIGVGNGDPADMDPEQMPKHEDTLLLRVLKKKIPIFT